MLAAYASAVSADDPLSALTVGQRPPPRTPDGWTTVTIRAAALNHHDLWSLRGVGLPPHRLPMILGTDGAGVDEEGHEVVIHPVIASPDWTGDETLDPQRTLLSERFDGTLAERVAVPRRNVVRKPPELSFEEAACLPSAWLTAYRMLFTMARPDPGSTLLVQGTHGGMSGALISLGRAAGLEVWATATSEQGVETGRRLGAHAVFERGARIPRQVETVADNVGADTWAHSIRCLKPGGTLVTCGATSGDQPGAELRHIFFRQLRVIGTTMGTRHELERLLALVARTAIRPEIEATYDLSDASRAFGRLLSGGVNGKLVLRAS